MDISQRATHLGDCAGIYKSAADILFRDILILAC